MSPSPLLDLPLTAMATRLFVYPVKSCAGVEVEALELDARGGPAGDRRWAIVDAEGNVTWQGSHPRLARVAPRFHGEGSGGDPARRLVLEAPGVDAVATPPAQALRPCEVRLWNDRSAAHDTFAAADAGDEVAGFLARATGAPLRLVRLGEAACAREGLNALHLVFEASVAAVDAELARAGHPAADARRYRPNVVLAGVAAELEPFLEDSAAALAWRHGDREIALAVHDLCVRCVVPNVDPATAEVSDAIQHALAALSQRRRPGAPTAFGVYARGEAGAVLARGDTASIALAF